jgi:hypothetical protein
MQMEETAERPTVVGVSDAPTGLPPHLRRSHPAHAKAAAIQAGASLTLLAGVGALLATPAEEPEPLERPQTPAESAGDRIQRRIEAARKRSIETGQIIAMGYILADRDTHEAMEMLRAKPNKTQKEKRKLAKYDEKVRKRGRKEGDQATRFEIVSNAAGRFVLYHNVRVPLDAFVSVMKQQFGPSAVRQDERAVCVFIPRILLTDPDESALRGIRFHHHEGPDGETAVTVLEHSAEVEIDPARAQTALEKLSDRTNNSGRFA